VDRRRVRFTSAEEMRRRLGLAWAECFTAATLRQMEREVRPWPCGQREDLTLALAEELGGLGARRLRKLIDPGAHLTTFANALVRGRKLLTVLRYYEALASVDATIAGPRVDQPGPAFDPPGGG
jgi:hypothetical protein